MVDSRMKKMNLQTHCVCAHVVCAGKLLLRAAGGIVALAGGGGEDGGWFRGGGAGGVGGEFPAAAVADAEEDALEHILRVEVERAGQGAYGASCWGISGYLDGFHRA